MVVVVEVVVVLVEVLVSNRLKRAVSYAGAKQNYLKILFPSSKYKVRKSQRVSRVKSIQCPENI